MDRDAIAREGRRAEATEALELELEREAALEAQMREIVLEEEGPRLDRETFAHLSEAEVADVREALGHLERDGELEEDDPFAGTEPYVVLNDEDEGEDDDQDEVARLAGEIENSRRRQRALERYLAVLHIPPTPADAA